MKNIDLGQSITILANLGVIAGIFFLVVELQQNNQVQQLQYEAEERARVNGVIELVVNNPDYSELLVKREDELSQSERLRLIALGTRMLLNFENLYEDMAVDRLTHDEAVRRVRPIWWRETFNYGVPLAWETFSQRADPGFIEWMEEYVIQDYQNNER